MGHICRKFYFCFISKKICIFPTLLNNRHLDMMFFTKFFIRSPSFLHYGLSLDTLCYFS